MENIILKIKKLIDKAMSTDSIEESETAMLLAQDLLQKYNLEMSHIESFKTKEDIQESFLPYNNDWESILMNIIAMHNFSMSIRHKHLKKISLVGKSANIETVIYLYNFFRNRLMSLSVEAYKKLIESKRRDFAEACIPASMIKVFDKGAFKNDYIKNFIDGGISGINSKMNEQINKAKIESPKLTDLIRISNSEIEKYANEKYNLKDVKRKHKKDTFGFEDGYIAGKNIQINKAIDPLTGKIIKLLN